VIITSAGRATTATSGTGLPECPGDAAVAAGVEQRGADVAAA